MKRDSRIWLALVGGVAGLVLGSGMTRAADAGQSSSVITVYKSPSCGCCSKWVDHLRAAGFSVVAHDTSDPAGVQRSHGVPQTLGSCHTATVGRYVIEGHVPADLIGKLLREGPAVAGLAVPGMVVGSPGMEGAGAQQYDVVAWDRQGRTRVYARR